MRKTGKHIVSKVLPGSIAEELEIEPGDELVSVSGKEIEDILDYHYLMNDEYVELLIRKPNGEEWELEIEKEYEDDIGIETSKWHGLSEMQVLKAGDHPGGIWRKVF